MSEKRDLNNQLQGTVLHRDHQNGRRSWGIRTHRLTKEIYGIADMVNQSHPRASFFPASAIPVQSSDIFKRDGGAAYVVERYAFPSESGAESGTTDIARHYPGVVSLSWIEGDIDTGVKIAKTFVEGRTETRPDYTFRRDIRVIEFQAPYDITTSPLTSVNKPIIGKVNNAQFSLGGFAAETYTMLYNGPIGGADVSGNRVTYRGYHEFVWRPDGWWRQALDTTGAKWRVLMYEPESFPIFLFKT